MKKSATPSKTDAQEAKAAKPGKSTLGDIKFSPSKKKTAGAAAPESNQKEPTNIKCSIIGDPDNGSKQGIVLTLTRSDGVHLSCWGDKVLADLVYGKNHTILETCHIQPKVYKLHTAEGVPLIGNKGYERRCYVIVFDELPDEDQIRTLMEIIAEEVNKCPTLKESQKVTVPDEFIVERNVPFVAKLANQQTISLCEAVLVPMAELQSYYCQNTQVFANFWHKGTMTAKIAAFFGVGSEWVMPSESH